MKGIKLAGRVLGILFVAVLALVLIFNIYSIVARTVFGEKNPALFGFSVAVVVSGSMEPAIGVDDMVIVKKGDEYRVGDVIMYDSGRSMVTHRVVERRFGEGSGEGSGNGSGNGSGAAKSPTGYITRGDSNNTDDPEVAAEKVAGRVVTVVPGAGKVIGFLQTPLGMLIMVGGALALIMAPWRQPQRQDGGGAGGEAPGEAYDETHDEVQGAAQGSTGGTGAIGAIGAIGAKDRKDREQDEI